MAKEKEMLFEKILTRVAGVITNSQSRDDTLKAICQILKEQVDYYDWVGFYLVEREKQQELILGPYSGEATNHTHIPFGQGICGQVAEAEKTMVIQDVSKEDNYLSCSVSVKSEIVVPVFKNGKIVGELDIDSHSLEPFSQEDRQFLEKICQRISHVF